MDRPGGLVVARLNGLCQLRHVCDGVRLEQVFVVEVVEENVQPALSVVDLCLEGRWSAAPDALHVCGEDFVDGHGVGGDVGAVTRCCLKG